MARIVRVGVLALLVTSCTPSVPSDLAVKPSPPVTSDPVTSAAAPAPPQTSVIPGPVRHPSRRVSRVRPRPSPQAGPGTLISTAYCLTGRMANGRPARRGAVAANRWPIGTRLHVTPSPVGAEVTVEDRYGHGTELDFAMPGDCTGARQWGRRRVSVEVIG